MISRTILASALAAGVWLSGLSPATAGEPCCSVYSYDPINGIVGMKDFKTGGRWQLTLRGKQRLAGLKVGQKVEFNAELGRLIVPGFEPVNGAAKKLR